MLCLDIKLQLQLMTVEDSKSQIKSFALEVSERVTVDVYIKLSAYAQVNALIDFKKYNR